MSDNDYVSIIIDKLREKHRTMQKDELYMKLLEKESNKKSELRNKITSLEFIDNVNKKLETKISEIEKDNKEKENKIRILETMLSHLQPHGSKKFDDVVNDMNEALNDN